MLFGKIEHETKAVMYVRKKRKKLFIYVSGYLATTLISLCSLFKIMH